MVLTNDPHPPSNIMQGVTIADFAVIATMSVVLPGTVIEKGVFVGAHSSIGGKTEKDMLYAGSPAKKLVQQQKSDLKMVQEDLLILGESISTVVILKMWSQNGF